MTIKKCSLWILGAAVLLLVTPAFAQENSGEVPIDVTIEHVFHVDFTGSNLLKVSLSKGDFKSSNFKEVLSQGQLTWRSNVPWQIMVRRTPWSGPAGWNGSQDANLKFFVRKKNSPGSTTYFLVPRDDWARWFRDGSLGKDKKSGQIDYKIDWTALTGNQRGIAGQYSSTISYTITEDTGP